MGLKVTNNAFGTLNAGINDSATTIVLTAGQGSRFPTLSAGDYFYATLIDTSNNLEIVKVTARSTDTMTVVRGQDNTTARAYSTNDRFELRPTAVMFTETIDKADAALPKSGGAITGNVTVGGDAFGGPLRRVTVREDATDSTFKGLKVVNAGGSGAVAGVYLQGYDWVQGGIWHGRTATGTERSGALILGTNPNTTDLSEGGLVGRIIVDNAGRVRMPYQPSFLAQAVESDTTYSGSGTLIPFPNEVFDVGNNYNTSTSRFTAPVTGVYMVSWTCWHNDSGNGGRSALYKNGTAYKSSTNTSPISTRHDAGKNQPDGVSIPVQLSAGDFIDIRVFENNVRQFWMNYFSAYLIG